MTTSAFPLIIGVAVIVVLVVLLASTRKSLLGTQGQPDSPLAQQGKYPYGYWMTMGITAGVLLGLALGFAVGSLPGGISIGIGLGLLAGKLLDNRYDKNKREYSDEQKRERMQRASWGLVAMLLLALGALAAFILSLFP